MSKTNRKKLLCVLVSIFAVSLAYRVVFSSEQKKAPLKFVTNYPTGQSTINIRPVESKASVSEENELPAIDISKLKESKKPPLTKGGNVFKMFLTQKPPAPPTPEQKKPLPPPVDTVMEELKLFKFLGFIENNAQRQIFMSKGGNVYIVAAGGVIDDKFRVNALEGRVEVISIETGKMISIPATEK
ncbi:hypothetical protein EPN18_07540 [bacterium]|nr:MAG: hypothetical protein EPN18_07540 [bacterium]